MINDSFCETQIKMVIPVEYGTISWLKSIDNILIHQLCTFPIRKTTHQITGEIYILNVEHVFMSLPEVSDIFYG